MSADAPIQTDIFDLFYFGVDRGSHTPESDTKNLETDTETGTSPPGDSLMAPLFPEDSITAADSPPPSLPARINPAVDTGRYGIPPLAKFARNAYHGLCHERGHRSGHSIPRRRTETCTASYPVRHVGHGSVTFAKTRQISPGGGRGDR